MSEYSKKLLGMQINKKEKISIGTEPEMTKMIELVDKDI